MYISIFNMAGKETTSGRLFYLRWYSCIIFKSFARLLSLSLTFFFLLSGILYAQNAGDNIFSGIQLHTIKISFAQKNYWDSLVYYYNRGDEHLMEVAAEVDGVKYDKIGARLKGNSSFSYPNNKKSFKLNFDEYNSSSKWDGLKAVHLNNMWGDPSFMREKIQLDFCRDAGIPAPRANYAKLYINDTLWGLYSLIEHVDKTFLKTRFGNKDGDLFKAGDAFDSSGAALISDLCWYGSVESAYTSRYELKTDGSTTAWPALISLINDINNNPSPASILPEKINLTSYYKILSSDILFANLDSYLNSGRNFYIYFLPTTGKMEWIVWDVGLNFGAYAVGVSKLETMSVTYVVSSSDRPLIGKIYETSVLKDAYLQTLNNLFTTYFSSTLLFPHIDSIANTIRSAVSEDPRKMYTLQQFETNITSDVNAEGGGGGVSRKPGIKSFITTRQSNVLTQLKNLGLTAVNTEKVLPSFYLSQNYPNPFNPSTTINFQLPANGYTSLKIYDLLGREISSLINEFKSAGNHSVIFSAFSIPSGVYIYKLTQGNYIQTKQMIVLK